ncbi:hypothetical protein CH341_17245 [Rhodoplanes roseus]|uniref:Uncharacterized protein n=1 Tax=Rhodoplanes roseus TaxID=29409 RepID=A0A327KXL4_9BRAD|nr:hypothetical protein CH341_17245 [Rhodoplanes roseus]
MKRPFHRDARTARQAQPPAADGPSLYLVLMRASSASHRLTGARLVTDARQHRARRPRPGSPS